MHPKKGLPSAYLARYPSAHSQRAMADALERAAGIIGRTATDLPWHEITYEVVSAMRARLMARYSPATTNLTLSAVRGIVRMCWQLRLVEHEAYIRAVDVPPWHAESLPAGRMIPPAELRRLFAAASGPSPLNRRDSAMLAILLGCGLRAAEVVHLTVADYDPATGEVRVLRGKGGKDRMAYLAAPGRQAMDHWLEVRGPSSGALLCDARRAGDPCVGGKMPPLSSKGIYYRVRALVKAASLGHASPHDFRRTHISLLLEGGYDISIVQRLVGHSSVTTTARYDRRPESVRRAAAESIDIPYQGANHAK